MPKMMHESYRWAGPAIGASLVLTLKPPVWDEKMMQSGHPGLLLGPALHQLQVTLGGIISLTSVEMLYESSVINPGTV